MHLPRLATTLLVLVAASAPSFSLLACSGDDASRSDSEINVAPSPFWKNKLSFPNEPFANESVPAQPRWVKFSIFTSAPDKVFFQDSNKYAFHYEFAKAHLPGFAEMGSAEFVRAALKADGQKLVTGAVLMAPNTSTMEYGIQLLREDAYAKEDVKRLHDLVKASIIVENGRSAEIFYMPSFEQSAAAARDREWLRANGVVVGSTDRWLEGDACYARGWAFGRAKLIEGSDIKRAYLEGRLKPDDILVTEGVPAEVPYVAGIVSLSPATPSSHVAILSQTWGVPFSYPATQDARDRVRSLAERNQEIALRTMGGGPGSIACRLEVIEPEGPIDATARAELAALRRPPAVEIPEKTHLGALTKPAVQLTPADVKYFGGKASNFGTLRRTIPESSPNALGISFDLWDAFLAQTLSTGKTLKQEIDQRLAGLAFPPDINTLEAKLVEIRKLVEDGAKIPAAERAQLFTALTGFGFDPKIKIRFRSSTNVEDGDVLSGAGLYDSYSGCLADDLDADKDGPSICDPSEPKERGVERAIKKVYASFFNTNAVLERLKYRIPEAKVGMALAAHYSFPDATEAANGVATARITDWSTVVDLVTQVGAESVTNPDGNALPESVKVEMFGEDDVVVRFEKPSSRVQLGARVMTWEDDYRAVARLIDRASRAFRTDHAFTGQELAIDIEYKKGTDGKLVLKQIRQIPERSQVPSVVPVLLNEATRLCVSQGESTQLLAAHRLKVAGAVKVRNGQLSEASYRASRVANVDFQLLEDGRAARKAGVPASFVGAEHTVDDRDFASDAWTTSFGKLSIGSWFTRLVAPAEIPLFVARDGMWEMNADYTSPRPTLEAGVLGETLRDHVTLVPCHTEASTSPEITTVTALGPNGIEMRSQLHYESGHPKTFGLAKWESTEIRGVTSSPIVLRGWFSQTFRPEHHNWTEDFMFEPELEDGLSGAIKEELAAKDIQAIVVLDTTRTDPRSAKFYFVKRSTGKIEEAR